jgi:hypothetical protein
MRRPSVWTTRHAHAARALELFHVHPDWGFRRIAAELAHEGMTAKSGAPHPPTNIILLLMLGEHGFPDWLVGEEDL